MRRYKVLIVDDEPDIVEFVSYNFNKNGFDVVVAHDGEHGIQEARAQRPDVVISDIMMPKMNGVKMCERLKEHAFMKHTPVIFLSATPDDLVALAALEAGGDCFMSKPIRMTVLMEAVIKMLMRYAARPR